MYGAFIGDIVGSKYEFDNIKIKNFPLFSRGCDFTDDSIMTAAVAKALMLTHQERQAGKDSSFQKILIAVMQDFGRRYPHPTGAYGGNFARWLKEKNPKPYGSFGNGSAMRVSPCALAATTMEEALALARASAAVSHNHPEGIKGAEAVCAAIFLAKTGRPKSAIREYITQYYYDLDFTLDAIRENYRFDVTCQGSVPQAIVAFLESESFEDAIRNVISIGGDCDTTGAITGSIAWVYYAGYDNWRTNAFDASMQKIKAQATKYLPREFVDIAEQFREFCILRAESLRCAPMLSNRELGKYGYDSPVRPTARTVTPEMQKAMTAFCQKYIVLMELLYQDKELNQWCRDYSVYNQPDTHQELQRLIYEEFMQDAYAMEFFPKVLQWMPYEEYKLEAALAGTAADLIYGIFLEIRLDYWDSGYLIDRAIGNGNLYQLMKAYLG